MKKTKIIICSWFAMLCVFAAPMYSMAGSPEFAYTEEKWALLRDDKLEYTEIADLVHEYNNTVIQNQIEYKEYNGESRDDIADDYYDAADEVAGRQEYPDSSDDNYGSSLSSYLNGQSQVDSLREQGDDNVDDGDIKKLGYDQIEAGLVKQAEELLVSYWSQTYSLESLKQKNEQAKAAYDAAVTQLSAGMSTQSKVLSAKEQVTSAQASVLSAESNLNKTKESLCLMLGWTYGTDVKIGQVPDPDLENISSIDMDTDVQNGLACNYALKIQEKKVANAQSVTNKESLQQNYNSQKETAATSIKNAYQNLMLSKFDYDSALQSYEIEKDSMSTAERKLQAGTITSNDYKNQQSAYAVAEVNVRTQKLALLQAQLEYKWAVNGLASVS